MLLVGADEQGGGEGVAVQLAGGRRRPGEAQFEAVAAALGFVAGDAAEILGHVVAFDDRQRKFQLRRQRFHRLQALLVLRVGVDIGVVPDAADVVALPPPVLHGIGGAVGAAEMDSSLFTISRRAFYCNKYRLNS